MRGKRAVYRESYRPPSALDGRRLHRWRDDLRKAVFLSPTGEIWI